jgi:DNA gyrase subunit A
VRPESTILTTTEKGIGKRSAIEDYRLIKRGGKGVINIKITERSGDVVGINEVMDEDELIMVTDRGQSIRFRASDARVIGRATQGVRFFNVPEGDRITAVSRVQSEEEENATEVAEEGRDMLDGEATDEEEKGEGG